MTDDRNPFGSIDDDGSDEDESQESTDAAKDDNKSFVALRRDRNRLEKLVKAQEPELEELRSFKAQVNAEKRVTEVAKVFAEIGLNPAQAKLYTSLNPEGEVEPKGVAEWALEFGLATAENVQVPDENPAPTPGFRPFVGEDAPGNQKVSRVDWLAKLKTNPEEAQRLFKQGRVDLSDLDLSK